MQPLKSDFCHGCWVDEVYCDACDDEDKEYIKNTLKESLGREISKDELCDLCKKMEIYKEVICARCKYSKP